MIAVFSGLLNVPNHAYFESMQNHAFSYYIQDSVSTDCENYS